tara:strand:- start:203 stop:607 length:405 start_codon:yes stop_codon:yes gene_type:complete
MNETKTTNESKKEKWIKAEHDKAVQIHWDNIDRIKKLKDEQSTKIYRIYSYQITNNLLDQEDYEDGKHELSIDLIKKEQLKHCIEVTELQKEIDKNSFEKSVETMQKNSNEEMLSKKYDRLFNKNKKAKEVDNG